MCSTQAVQILCMCVCACACLSGPGRGFLLSARNAREGWRLAPHGTVCYHSASLIPSPHVCNLTWWRRAGGRGRKRKKNPSWIQMLPRKQALFFFLFFAWFDFFLWFFFLHANCLLLRVTALMIVSHKFFSAQHIVLPPCCNVCQECHCNLSVSGFQEIHFSCFIESFCFQRYYVLCVSEVLVKLSLFFCWLVTPTARVHQQFS